MGSDLAHTLVSAARSVAAVATRSPESFERLPPQTSREDEMQSCTQREEEPQERSLASRTNKIASRICQAPLPFMRKSMSAGPSRALSAVGPPRAFLKKSVSLGVQRWEPLDETHPYVSERFYRDELPHPHVRIKSYSLGRMPPSCHARPAPFWHGLVPFHRHGSGSLERQRPADRPYAFDRPLAADRPYAFDRPLAADRPHVFDRPLAADRPYAFDRPLPADRPYAFDRPLPDRPYALDRSYPPLDRCYPPLDHTYPPLERSYPPERPYMLPSYLSPSPPILEDPPISTRRDWPDPRRQAAVFPDASRCPLTYQETLRAAQHKYVPLEPSHPRPAPPPRPAPGLRVDHPRPVDAHRGHQRTHLPRGHSWPSPHQPAPFPPRELNYPREAERAERTLAPREVEHLRESREGRASYASQSSGRGSVGPYGHSGGHLRQSVSMTPTLLSSPETTEDSQRLRPDTYLRDRRAQRRNTSVDESYEWDAVEQCVDPDVLRGMKGEQAQVRGGQRREPEPRGDPPCSSPDPQDPLNKGLSRALSPPLVSHDPRSHSSRSLSEARFKALRLEYQEYCRALESSYDPPSDPESDSNSALL